LAQVKNESEHMFVEWAQGIQADNYDVERVAELLNSLGSARLEGLDVGGGIGRYAQLVCEKVPGCRVMVLDKSELAEESFVEDPNLDLARADYFDFNPKHRYDFVIFKTVLHHFIADDEESTIKLQRRALEKAHQLLRPGGLLLIEENFYQGVFGLRDDTPGKLIFAITRQRWVENVVRRLGANTAGEGVRFRAIGSWQKMLEQEHFNLHSLTCSPTWGRKWPLWQRLPLLSSGRFQGVLVARSEIPTAKRQKVRNSSSFIGGFFAPAQSDAPAFARVSRYWEKASTRVRWYMTLIAITGPIAFTTCAITEA